MSKYTAVLTVEERLLRDQVMQLWAAHQGWETWPKDRRHDAIQIQHFTRLLGLPVAFWADLIARVPLGHTFRWLTTAPAPGRVSLIQELAPRFIAERDQRERERREDELAAMADPAAKSRADEMVHDLAKRMRMKVA